MIWGKTDCCQFVGECVESVTGENPARYFRYAGEKAARSLIKTYGGLDGLLTSVFGEPSHQWRNGYVGVMKNNGELAAGVFINNRFVCRVENGLMDYSPDRAAKVWDPCHK